MTNYRLLVPAVYFLVSVFASAEEKSPDAFARDCAAAGDVAATRTVRGVNKQWLFLKSELEHLGTGAFWTKDWKEVSKSGVDPVPVFLALNEKLSALGVKFIFVPIPAKASIYPEKFTDGIKMKAKVPADDAVTPISDFLERMRSGGIAVIDIESDLKANRASGGERSYCMTDSHPAPWTCELIAKRVAGILSGQAWAKQAAEDSKLSFVRGDPGTQAIKGDLIPEDQRDTWEAEEVTVRKAGIRKGGGITSALPDDESSPVILLGDSHTLIFHEGGDMLMSGAGVPDHLQAELGFKVYLAASRGSSSQAQRQIYKGKDFWEGKKALVWVSSVREFTQERKWLKLPRLPK
ncbi:MAG: hypothetical protein GY899_07425 [Verrucomicrobiaceae bacterium]|nr:hypothetical protein [Verrucomicrobiaceae bacterium]